MFLFWFFMYIIAGAVISSLFYYVKARDVRGYCDYLIPAVVIGIFWPVAAVFAFGLHYAEREASKR